MKKFVVGISHLTKYLTVMSVFAVALAACAPGQAGNNPGPFANSGAPGDSNTASGPTPEIQPGGVSQTAEAPGSQVRSTAAAGDSVTSTAQTSESAGMSSTVSVNATDAVAAPTVQPAAVIPAGLIHYGVVEFTISETIVPSVTAQILPVRLKTISTTNSTNTAEPTLATLTGTILLMGGFAQLNPDSLTYQQPRILVMPLDSYLPADAVVITPSLGNPFFDALRLASTSNNQAILSSSQLRTTVLFNQSPALSLKSEITVAVTSDAQHLDFVNGKGVRFVSALTEQQKAVTAEGLYYFYHGLTNDERYYVSVILPIVHTPFAITSTVEAGANYDKYLKDVEEQLGSGDDATYSQALAEYDRIVSSIRVIP